MRKRKNIIFLIISSFWFLSLLFLAPVSAEESHATGTQTISAGEMENAGINFLTKFLPWEKDSAQIDVFYNGEEIILPAGRLDLIFKTPGTRLQAGRIPLTLQINVEGRIGHVRKVGGGRAIVDFNHPFSGKDVTYNVTVKRLVTDKKEQVECMIARMMSGLPFKVSEKDKKISVVGPKLPDQLIKPIIDKIKEVTGETIVFEQDKKEAKSIKNAEVR